MSGRKSEVHALFVSPFTSDLVYSHLLQLLALKVALV